MNSAAQTYSQACRAFAARRHSTVFTSPVVAHKAELVEFDLRLLVQCGRSIPAITKLALKSIAEFEAMLTMG